MCCIFACGGIKFTMVSLKTLKCNEIKHGKLVTEHIIMIMVGRESVYSKASFCHSQRLVFEMIRESRSPKNVTQYTLTCTLFHHQPFGMDGVFCCLF